MAGPALERMTTRCLDPDRSAPLEDAEITIDLASVFAGL